MARIYISSSWNNQQQPLLVEKLRLRGHKVYDFRHPEGRNDRNVWESVSNRLGVKLEYSNGNLTPEVFGRMHLDKESLSRFKEHFAAMEDADTCILLLPCGRSSHVEAGFMDGHGKRVFVYDTSKEVIPELMYLTFDDYFFEEEELLRAVDQPIPGVCRVCGCTMKNPCYHPDHGYCWWADSSHTICSHCADPLIDGRKKYASIKDDPQTEHCVNDKSNAFKY